MWYVDDAVGCFEQLNLNTQAQFVRLWLVWVLMPNFS
jgi:hypothetical protein